MADSEGQEIDDEEPDDEDSYDWFARDEEELARDDGTGPLLDPDEEPICVPPEAQEQRPLTLSDTEEDNLLAEHPP